MTEGQIVECLKRNLSIDIVEDGDGYYNTKTLQLLFDGQVISSVTLDFKESGY